MVTVLSYDEIKQKERECKTLTPLDQFVLDYDDADRDSSKKFLSDLQSVVDSLHKNTKQGCSGSCQSEFEFNSVNFLGHTFLRDYEDNELRPCSEQPDEPGVFLVESEFGQVYKVAFSIEEI